MGDKRWEIGDGRREQVSPLFITFEGPEGAGKSTQLRHLRARLEAAGHRVLATKEPGGTPAGDKVRATLLDPTLTLTPQAEFLLYSASRAELCTEVLRPALERGDTVLCDRYADSTLAYQGYGRGLDMAFLRRVTHEATGGLEPTLTVLLDLDPAAGLRRVAARGQPDRLENAPLDFHVRVREGFLALAAAEPERWLVLDATQSEDVLARLIWERVQATSAAQRANAKSIS